MSVFSPELNSIESVNSGFTDKSLSVKVDTNNLYQIGSITKSFIAAILLQLEAENSGFHLDDKVVKYLPQYAKWKDVSVRQLLNMTSGIPNYTDNKEFWSVFGENP